jgi:ATP-dependent RNA helicase RhlE
LKTFKALSCGTPLHQGLLHALTSNGFTTPTEIQAAAIPHGMSGKDITATAQTGTGKTLAFLLPAMNQLLHTYPKGSKTCNKTEAEHPSRALSKGHPSVLVLAPTRELALQIAAQHDQLAARLLPKAAVIIGGASENIQIQQLRAGARVVIATPGRLEDLLDRKLVRLDEIKIVVLDEADRMLDMGFIPAIRRIVRLLPKQRQTMCFSATADPNVQSIVDEILLDPVRLTFGGTRKPAESVRLTAYQVDQSQKSALLARVVADEPGQSLVFVATKRSSERVAERLRRAGLEVAVIHGDRSQSQRNGALAAFQNGKIKVLVATDVASRGIHVDDIAQVVNYDLPNIPEDFVHRVGRTGRAGATGRATTFFAHHERNDVLALERTLKLKMEWLTIGAELEREERGRKVEASDIRVKTVAAGRSTRGMVLEGESLRRYGG